jgi:putative transposase
MIDRNHELPVKRQAQLLDISRSSAYYRPRPMPPETLALMKRIDDLHLELPFAGSRMLRDLLAVEGTQVGRTGSAA